MSNFEDTKPVHRDPARALPAATDNIVALLVLGSEYVVTLTMSLLTGIGYHLAVYDKTGDMNDYASFGAVVFLFYAAYQVLHKQYGIPEVLRTREGFRRAFMAWTIAYLCAFAVIFITKDVEDLSRGAVVLLYLAGTLALPAMRMAFAGLFKLAYDQGWLVRRRVFLLGSSDRIREFQEDFAPRLLAREIAGSIILPLDADTDEAQAPDTDHQSRLVSDAVGLARKLAVDDVVVLLPWSESRLINQCTDRFMTVPAALHLGPEALLNRFSDVEFSRIGEFNSLQMVRMPMNSAARLTKRVFDLTVAATALALLSPLLLLTGLLVRLDSPGPALFVQRRYGFNQEEFRIFKFRTMTTMDDGDDVKQATAGDMRITRLGAILRKYNIDELPQLLNVITGDMSIVGPRPHAVSHNVSYERRIGLYARRHNVKPGITGWAQINGWRGETDTDEKMQARVDHDLFYIDNWSVWLDIYIVAMTVLSPKAFRNAR